ncbi:MAG: ribosome maturation factor RimM [Succinivibrio sp.]
MADIPRPVGSLGSPFGVKGWIKVRSFTDQPEDLFDYSPWFIRQRGAEWREVQVEEYKPHGKGFIAKLNVVSTPEDAKAYAGAEIGIRRSSLPPAPEGQIYLNDLIGCEVTGNDGVMLGKVSGIRDYGAAPIMVVSPSDHLAMERKDDFLIPYVVGPIVKAVDLEAMTIEVEWGVDY